MSKRRLSLRQMATAPSNAQELHSSVQDAGGQVQLELQDCKNTDQQPAMDIAQIYQVLARDDGSSSHQY